MGDKDTTVACALHRTEYSRSCGSSLQTDIEVTFEGSWGVLFVQDLCKLQCAIGFRDTLILVSKAKLGKGATGAEQSSSVSWNKDE